MASPISAGDTGSGDIVSDAIQLVVQGLSQLKSALRLQKQEAERKVQEALRLQEERAATALREMERKLQEKDEAIRALQQRLEETQEGTTAPEGSGEEGGVQQLAGRVEKVETSLQRAIQTFMPRVDYLLGLMEKPQSTHASVASAVSARKTASKGGAAAGSGEEPPSSTPSSSGTGHQGAVEEEIRARQRVELRMRREKLRMERARKSRSPLGEQLCEAAEGGRLNDVQRLIDSGVDVNYRGPNGFTLLLNAAYKAHADVVSLLLRRGADVNAITSVGNSALHFAAETDRSGRCVHLLLGAGADVDARAKYGDTPLHVAANWSNEEAVRALLAAGARRDLKPWSGFEKNKTPFDLATSPAVQNLLRG